MTVFTAEFLTDLLKATCVLSLSAVAAALLLWLGRVESPRWRRAVWAGVLLQGCLLWQFNLAIPWYEAAPVEFTEPNPLEESPLLVTAPLEPVGEPVTGKALPHPPQPHISYDAVSGPSWSFNWPANIVLVWICGMLVALVRWLAGYVGFLRSLKPLDNYDPAWAAQWRRIQEEAGIPRPLLLMVTAGDGPLLCRLLSGYAVIVPQSLWEQLNTHQRRLILLHELAHYQRGDVWKSFVVRLFALPHWFNPLAWLAVRRFDEAAEWACDDQVRAQAEGGVTSFADALLQLGMSAPRPLAHSPAAYGHPLARRIHRILTAAPAPDAWWKRLLLGVALVTAITVNAIRLDFVEAAPPEDSQSPDLSVAANFVPQQQPDAEDDLEDDKVKVAATMKKLPEPTRKAAEFLFSRQKGTGEWDNGNGWTIGLTGLVATALLKADVPPQEPHVARALNYLRRQQAKRTYDISTQTTALCLAADGQRDAAQIARNVKALEQSQIQQGDGSGGWSYGRGGMNMESGDSSNGGFAVTALEAAAAYGAKVEKQTWRLAYDHWKRSQNKNGGWGYVPPKSPPTGSMTCTGLASFIIAHRRLYQDQEDQSPDIQALVKPSVRWMNENISLERNPGNGNWQLYYLMTLRRAGEWSGRQTFGEKDWYQVGREFLLQNQSELNGAWKGAGPMEDELVGTAMALLFLQDGPPKAVKNKPVQQPKPQQGDKEGAAKLHLQLPTDETALRKVWQDLTDDQEGEVIRRNLYGLMRAVHMYYETHNVLPPAVVPNDDIPPEKRLSGLVLLLPHLDAIAFPDKDGKQEAIFPESIARLANQVYKSIDLKKGWDSPENLAAAKTMIPVFLAPGDLKFHNDQGIALSHFAFVRGANGKDDGAFTKEGDIVIINGKKQIDDGSSNTLGIGQIESHLGPWIAAGSSTSRHVYHYSDKSVEPTFDSRHNGACYFVNCDGFAFFLDVDNIAAKTLHAMATRSGGEFIDLEELKKFRFQHAGEWKEE